MTGIPQSLFLQHGDVSTAVDKPANYEDLGQLARTCFNLTETPNFRFWRPRRPLGPGQAFPSAPSQPDDSMYDASYACDFSLVHPSFYKHIPDGSYLYVNLTLPENPKREVKKEDISINSHGILHTKVKIEQSGADLPFANPKSTKNRQNDNDIIFVKEEPVEGDLSSRKRARDAAHKPVKRNKLKDARGGVPPSPTGAETPSRYEAVTGIGKSQDSDVAEEPKSEQTLAVAEAAFKQCIEDCKVATEEADKLSSNLTHQCRGANRFDDPEAFSALEQQRSEAAIHSFRMYDWNKKLLEQHGAYVAAMRKGTAGTLSRPPTFAQNLAAKSAEESYW